MHQNTRQKRILIRQKQDNNLILNDSCERKYARDIVNSATEGFFLLRRTLKQKYDKIGRPLIISRAIFRFPTG